MRLRELLTPRYDGPIGATIHGIADRLRDRSSPLHLGPDERLDGRTCLVTGANRGLGLAIATSLASLGGHVVLACRSGIPEVMDVVRRGAAGRGTVEAVRVDLDDLDSVLRMVEELAEDGITLDVTVLNAGMVSRAAHRNRHGLDRSFQVNYLANVLLVRALRERGVLRGAPTEDDVREQADRSDAPLRMPRLVAVGSESHRSAPPLDLARLGEFRPWTMRETMREYATSKLLLETWASELARRTTGTLSVHTLCPGAVRSDIAREAPRWTKPVLDVAMRALFEPPEVAARPVTWLCAAHEIEGRTGVYLHRNRRRERSARATDPTNGAALWDASERLLERLGYGTDTSRRTNG